MELQALPGLPGVWRLRAATNGYLIVRGEASLLVDCPPGDWAPILRDAGLPAPEAVLHTQVQAEHCGEWAAFPDAEVYVAAGCHDLATRSPRFLAEADTVWPPDRAWETRGEEPYGIAGCVTARPPGQPLRVVGLLGGDSPFSWRDVHLEALALPGSDKRAIGLWWADTGVVFSGDLLHAGGYLVNLYDLERAYGLGHGYQQLADSLARVADLGPRLLLPTTGEPIADFPAAAAALRRRLEALRQAPVRRAGEKYAITNRPPLREFGRYREVFPGLFQNTNYGNVVLFVRPDGGGLMADPDNCVWKSWEENCREWHADLDLLERETGLRRVEWALCTHYHGDHVEYADELRRRYGTAIVTTPDVAAVMERPGDFPYPAAIDWYNFPFDHVRVDRRLAYEQQVRWHDTPITPIHTPGHCNAHVSYLVEWQGQRVLVAGDVIQYGAGPIGCGLPIAYNDNSWPDRGIMTTLARLRHRGIQWLVGGHSHCAHDPDGAILADMAEVADAWLAIARDLVPGGDLLTAMTPPGYDAIRPAQTC